MSYLALNSKQNIALTRATMYFVTMIAAMPKKASKIASRALTLRVPDDMLARLNVIADDQDRSLNAQVVRALREWLVSNYPIPADSHDED